MGTRDRAASLGVFDSGTFNHFAVLTSSRRRGQAVSAIRELDDDGPVPSTSGMPLRSFRLLNSAYVRRISLGCGAHAPLAMSPATAYVRCSSRAS